jgi:flagellar hook-associated protein 3 FlgL
MASENMEVRIPANGEEIFTGVEDLFDALRLLKDELQQVNPDIAVISAQAARPQEASGQIQTIRAEGASVFSRVKLATTQLDQLEKSFSEMLSGTEDADMAQAIVELKSQETAYQTTIATAARLIQPSLLDFLS